MGVSLSSSLPPLNDSNKTAYLVNGVCDSSEPGVVTVSFGEADQTPVVTQPVTCTNNRFSDSINLDGVVLPGTITIAVTQGGDSDSVTVPNNSTNPLAFQSPLPEITELNKSAYPVGGSCNSLASATVNLTIGEAGQAVELDQDLACSDHRFSGVFDVTMVTADPVTITVTQVGSTDTDTDVETVSNAILVGVSLSSSLLPLDDSNKAAYLVSGVCDSSEPGVVTVSFGEADQTPVVTQSVTCTNNRFSASFNLESVRVNPVTVKVAQGSNEDSAVVNNEIQLFFNLPLPNLTEINKSTYPISGQCESSEGVLTVTMGGIGEPPELTQILTCSSDSSSDSFLDSIDVSHVTADPVTLVLTQGLNSEMATVSNEILVGVSLSSSLPNIDDSNKAAYLISGVCDSSESGVIVLTMGGIGEPPRVTQNLTCTNNRFSEAVNVGQLTANPIFIKVTQNSSFDSAIVDNNSTGGFFIHRPLLSFTDLNKTSYTVSGVCDSNVAGAVTLTIGSSLSQQLTCLNNRFSENVDVSLVREKPTSLVVIHGNQIDYDSINNLMTLAPVAACTSGGTGDSESDPKVICTYSELNTIRADVNGSGDIVNQYYALGVDIDASPSWSEGSPGCGAYDPVVGIAGTNPCSGLGTSATV